MWQQVLYGNKFYKTRRFLWQQVLCAKKCYVIFGVENPQESFDGPPSSDVPISTMIRVLFIQCGFKRKPD